MNISENGMTLIKSFEGLRLKAYKCLSSEKYYTIGYGHYGSDVTKDMVITEEQADKLLKADVDKYVDNVNKYQSIYNFNQNEFDALVSFAFNVGSINQLTNNGKRDRVTIRKKILEYNKSGGKVIQGLVTRRQKELELFDTAVENETSKSISDILGAVTRVLNGQYGNGEVRKKNLTEDGFNATYIQSVVNLILNYRN